MSENIPIARCPAVLLLVSVWCSWLSAAPPNGPADDPKAIETLERLNVYVGWSGVETVWRVTVPQNSAAASWDQEDLGFLRGLPQLRVLSLFNAKISDRGAAELARPIELRRLALDGSNITDDGLAAIEKLPRLQGLSLNRTNISDAGLAHLRSLKTLRALEIKGTEVTDAGLAYLAGLDRLEHLSLNGTHITDSGLAHLAKLKHLTRLGLDGTRVTDAGLVHLKGHASLQGIGLAGDRITNAGLTHLAALPHLQGLDLRRTSVNDEGVRQLRRALPNLGFVSYGNVRYSSRYSGDEEEAARKANHRILERVKARDLAAFKVIVEKEPAAVNLEWMGVLTKAGDSEAGMMPLHFAVRNGDLAMMQFLIERGADLNARTSMIPAPISLAAWQGNLEAVKLLLKHGAAVKGADWDDPEPVWDTSPLLEAATREIAATLIAAGANPCAMSSWRETPLHHARNREIAKLLLDHGAHVNAREDRHTSQTPLHAAIAGQRFDVAELLIERGADVNATASGESPLCFAARYGNDRIAAMLLARGASVNGTEAVWPLREAVERNRPGIVRLLLKAGATVPKYDKPAWTLLHAAAKSGCGEEIIAMLLESGLPVDARTAESEPDRDRQTASYEETPPGSGSRTPLHVAIQAGNEAAAKSLMAHGADVHAKTADGQTPASLAGWVEAKRPVSGYVQCPEGMAGEMNRNHDEVVDARNAARKAIGKQLRKADKP